MVWDFGFFVSCWNRIDPQQHTILFFSEGVWRNLLAHVVLKKTKLQNGNVLPIVGFDPTTFRSEVLSVNHNAKFDLDTELITGMLKS